MAITIPAYPQSLRTEARRTDTKLLARECTALLKADSSHSYEWLTERDRSVLATGKTQPRRDVLHKHYVYRLEATRQAALDSGFAEPGVLPESVLQALGRSPLDRLNPKKSRALRDAIGAVKQLDDDERRGAQQVAQSPRKGRSPQKAAKAAKDRQIRSRMKQPKGAKPQRGRAA